MIIYAKKDEVAEIIEKLETIETNFWLQYKQRSIENRNLLKKEFEEVYNKLYALIEGKQLEMTIKE